MKSKLIVLTVFGAFLLMSTTGYAKKKKSDDGPDDTSDKKSLDLDISIGGSANGDDASEADDDADEPVSKIGIAVAPKLGLTVHTIFNELKPMILMEIEAGVLLLDRHLEIDLALAWARPKSTLTEDDPRLADGSYDWEIKQDFLSLGIVGRYRLLDKSYWFGPYAALGPRILMLHTKAEGESDSGNKLGTNEQFETRFGGCVAIGGELYVGPGAALVEVGLTFGDLDGHITGDTSSAALDVYLGYRFMFDL